MLQTAILSHAVRHQYHQQECLYWRRYVSRALAWKQNRTCESRYRIFLSDQSLPLLCRLQCLLLSSNQLMKTKIASRHWLPVRAFLKICSKPKNFRMDKFTVGWKRRPPLYGPKAELNCTRYPRLTWTWPLSSSQTTRNWMTRSGIAATWRAILYSGFFWKREEFSRVDASSIIRVFGVQLAHDLV